MIKFECSHCKNPLALDEQYAGRDGWCRVCKQMVVVPKPGGPQCLDDLSSDERYSRMKNLLKYAATKSDEYKLLLARAQAATSSLLSGTPAVNPSNTGEQHAVQAEEVASLGEELRVAREQLSSNEQIIIQLRENTDATQGKKIATLYEELESLHAELAERDKTLTEISEDAEATQVRQESSDARLIEQEEEIARLKEACDTEKTARQDTESDLGVVQQSSIRLIEQLAIPQKKLEDISARAEEAEARESELALALAKLDTSTITILDEAKSELGSANDKLCLARDEVATLKDKADKRKRVLAEALTEVERLGGALTSVEDELEGATTDQSDYASSLQASQARVQELNDELDEERKGHVEARTAQTEHLDELNDANASIASLQETITALENELAEAVSASKNLPAVMGNAFAAKNEGGASEWAAMPAHAEEEEVREEQDQMMQTFLRFLEKK